MRGIIPRGRVIIGIIRRRRIHSDEFHAFLDQPLAQFSGKEGPVFIVLLRLPKTGPIESKYDPLNIPTVTQPGLDIPDIDLSQRLALRERG